MKKINLLLFLGCWMYTLGLAQGLAEEEVRFSGVVINSATTQPVPDVNCRDGERVTTTDLMGRFVINTLKGDTIYFTHIGYKSYEIVVPDTLAGGEYMLAVFLSSDTINLPEVVVRRRYGEQARQYRMNAKNNMAGIERDAFSNTLEMTPEQNQKRILDDFAASTNKGHVNVKLGVGLESWRAYEQLKKARKFQEAPEPLMVEELDLLKMIFTINRREKTVK